MRRLQAQNTTWASYPPRCGHEAAERGVERDGTVNGYGRELDELAEALGFDEE